MLVYLQSVELTSEAMEFLKGIFSTFDDDKVCYCFIIVLNYCLICQLKIYLFNRKVSYKDYKQ